jgi:hypothetical protein
MENVFHVDERFGSFYERLNSLRRPGESDRDFWRTHEREDTYLSWLEV